MQLYENVHLSLPSGFKSFGLKLSTSTPINLSRQGSIVFGQVTRLELAKLKLVPEVVEFWLNLYFGTSQYHNLKV